MDKYTKIILSGLFLLFLATLVFAYFRFYVAGDYIIQTEVSCDPAEESCFVYECDPETEECTGDPEEDTWYYKVISKRAAFMPACESGDEECPEPMCSIGEADCEVMTCSEEALMEAGEGIYCSNPADFQDEEAAEEEEEPVTEGAEAESSESSADGEEEPAPEGEEASEGSGEAVPAAGEAPEANGAE